MKLIFLITALFSLNSYACEIRGLKLESIVFRSQTEDDEAHILYYLKNSRDNNRARIFVSASQIDEVATKALLHTLESADSIISISYVPDNSRVNCESYYRRGEPVAILIRNLREAIATNLN